MNPTRLRLLNRRARLALAFCALGLLLSCTALPDKPERPAVYDFGPGALSAAAASTPTLPPLTLAEVEAPASLDSNAMLYRLLYADAAQLRPYALARWSMPPAQLLRQRLRDGLEGQRAVLNGSSSTEGALLRIELEEFAQLFGSPDHSVGLVRLRATLVRIDSRGERLLGQRRFVAQRPAASADAPGGVQALARATDAAVQELAQWLVSLR